MQQGLHPWDAIATMPHPIVTAIQRKSAKVEHGTSFAFRQPQSADYKVGHVVVRWTSFLLLYTTLVLLVGVEMQGGRHLDRSSATLRPSSGRGDEQ